MIKSARHSNETMDRQARKTALIVAGVLLLIAAWSLYRERTTAVAVLVAISMALVLVGMFVPPAARGFHRFWMGLALVLGYINSRILLSLLFYGLFVPYGFFSRLVGRDPLRRRGPREESYWVKRSRTRQTREQFERLF